MSSRRRAVQKQAIDKGSVSMFVQTGKDAPRLR